LLWQLLQDNIVEGEEEMMQDADVWLQISERQFQNVEKVYWEESLIGKECEWRF